MTWKDYWESLVTGESKGSGTHKKKGGGNADRKRWDKGCAVHRFESEGASEAGRSQKGH